MPETIARPAYGLEMHFGEGSEVVTFEIVSFSRSGSSRDSIDASHMESPDQHVEKLPGMIDAGAYSFEVNVDPDFDEGDVYAMRKQTLTIEYPISQEEEENGITNPATWAAKAFMKSWNESGESRGKISGTIEFDISSKPVKTPAS